MIHKGIGSEVLIDHEVGALTVAVCAVEVVDQEEPSMGAPTVGFGEAIAVDGQPIGRRRRRAGIDDATALGPVPIPPE